MKKADFYRNARHDLTGPLEGIRVIDATTSWAGPMCACMLADLGADVIKVEAREGEVSRRIPPFLPGHDTPVGFAQASVNRNKRSLTLDLRHPEGREIFLKLTKRSDIIVQNFRPGTFDKWGIGYEDARAVKPDIIYISISGYGQFGPIHDRVAYDPLAQAMSGFISMNGTADGPPVKAPTWICDDLGGLHGAIGALSALRHRDRTGEGQHVDVAMLDAMLFQSNGFLTLAALGLEPKRMGNEFSFSIPSNVYRCRDGHVLAGVLLDTHWKVVARMAGRPDLAENPDYATIPGRMKNRAECDAMLAAWCAARTVDEAVEECAKLGIACAKVRTYTEAARDPNTLERDMLQEVAQEDGKLAPITGPAAKFSRTPTRVRSGAPRLGAHTDEVLEELGIDAKSRERLRSSGVI
ncbi:MAG: CoA transferase [Candidatus Binatus sp.]|uniref:CaiB/BaiF CoA transferase family protein n=1 Tax=Candidatus Binatus sp. TaxID=2811406 RepID=UPI0027157C33|nr:CoA transferase [Candidatus Binatus sp.]MDO8434146.1 CoA transferase [Candidatus Binatus sp.]